MVRVYILFLLFIAMASIECGDAVDVGRRTVFTVSDTDQLIDALSQARPGSVVEIAPGYAINLSMVDTLRIPDSVHVRGLDAAIFVRPDHWGDGVIVGGQGSSLEGVRLYGSFHVKLNP